jgi:hypothetical protein
MVFLNGRLQSDFGHALRAEIAVSGPNRRREQRTEGELD